MRKTLFGAAVALLFAALPAFAQQPAPAFKVEPGFTVTGNPKSLPDGKDNSGLKEGPPPAGSGRVTPKSAYCGCDDGCKCAPACACGPTPKAGEARVGAPAGNTNPMWFALYTACGDNSSCSGTPVFTDGKQTLVLTNSHFAHPTRDRFGYTVGVPNGKSYKATRVDSCNVWTIRPGLIDMDGLDLAFLVVDADLGAVPIADADPQPNEAVGQWGYGGNYGVPLVNGPQPIRKPGVVRGYKGNDLVTTIACSSGDSGSGVFNSRGELVAVTHGSSSTEGISHLATRVTVVRAHAAARPVLSRLFPRFTERMAAKSEAREAAREAAKQPEAKVDPLAPPPAAAPAAPRTGRVYRVGNGPWISEEEFLRQFPGGLQGSACPNGRCPNVQPAR
jgi:hypothetical protein